MRRQIEIAIDLEQQEEDAKQYAVQAAREEAGDRQYIDNFIAEFERKLAAFEKEHYARISRRGHWLQQLEIRAQELREELAERKRIDDAYDAVHYSNSENPSNDFWELAYRENPEASNVVGIHAKGA